jgi:hypothetical protein
MSAAAPFVPQMRKLCSWCSCLIQAGHEPTLHGICDACREKHFGGLRRRTQPDPELPAAPAGRAEPLS